jgi:hypothetical protein
MLITITLAVVIVFLAIIPTSAAVTGGPDTSSYDNPTAIGSMASGGGNLVPLW